MRDNYSRPEFFTGRGSDEHIPYRREVSEGDDTSKSRNRDEKRYRGNQIGILNIDHSKRPENVSYFWVEVPKENGKRNYDNLIRCERIHGRPVPKKRHPEIPSISESMHNFLFKGRSGISDDVANAFTDHYARLEDEMESQYIITGNMILMERDAYLDVEDREEIERAHAEALNQHMPEGYNNKGHLFNPEITVSRAF